MSLVETVFRRAIGWWRAYVLTSNVCILKSRKRYESDNTDAAHSAWYKPMNDT